MFVLTVVIMYLMLAVVVEAVVAVVVVVVIGKLCLDTDFEYLVRIEQTSHFRLCLPNHYR